MKTFMEVSGLRKYFPVGSGFIRRRRDLVRAVDSVSFAIGEGEALGLVGESGCGKTTTGRLVLRLIEPDAGHVYFDGVDIFALPPRELKQLRPRMQIVFQDPFSTLNPRMTVLDMLTEPMRYHGIATGEEAEARAYDLIERVGMNPEHLGRYPHEFSGGQRQRLGIARALSVSPDFIVFDEPTSSLDVSVQAQILNLVKDLQRAFHLTYLFISHHLNVIRYMCDRVAVMYLGQIVEAACTEVLFRNPQHPYTQALLSAIPVPDPRTRRERIILSGEVPSPLHPPPACRFNTRCPYAFKRCFEEEPELLATEPDHPVACHLVNR